MNRTERLRRELLAHAPAGARERWSLDRTLALLAWLDDAFDEHRDPTHLTGSAIVHDATDRILLHRHKRLGIWLQPGGHLDPGETPAEAAVRETQEETGLIAHHPASGPCLVHVDLHEGPRGHVHLDLRYRLTADGTADLAPNAGESPDVIWASRAEVRELGDVSLNTAVDASVRTAGGEVPPRHGDGPDRPRHTGSRGTPRGPVPGA